jgi:ethanolamine utilization protein EutN
MFLGRVVGEVWATRKSADLEGKRLLVIEALDERREPGAPKVTPVVAADPLGAAFGQRVIVAFGKAAACHLRRRRRVAFEAAVSAS